MARPLTTAGERTHTICTRLSDGETAQLDTLRGNLSRSEYLRWLLRDATRRQDAT